MILRSITIIYLTFFSFWSCSEKLDSQIPPVLIYQAQHLTKSFKKTNWDTVSFDLNNGGTKRYVISTEPLLTAWNFVAINVGKVKEDKTYFVTVRLNAYGEKKMIEFSSNPNNLKAPLGLQVNNRWINFNPLLNPVSDRITLHGFTKSDIATLQNYLDNR